MKCARYKKKKFELNYHINRLCFIFTPFNGYIISITQSFKTQTGLIGIIKLVIHLQLNTQYAFVPEIIDFFCCNIDLPCCSNIF